MLGEIVYNKVSYPARPPSSCAYISMYEQHQLLIAISPSASSWWGHYSPPCLNSFLNTSALQRQCPSKSAAKSPENKLLNRPTWPMFPSHSWYDVRFDHKYRFSGEFLGGQLKTGQNSVIRRHLGSGVTVEKFVCWWITMCKTRIKTLLLDQYYAWNSLYLM